MSGLWEMAKAPAGREVAPSTNSDRRLLMNEDMRMVHLPFDALPRGPGFWYLASPYSKYEEGLQAAYEKAVHVTASLILNGFSVFSPIVHTHSVAVISGLDPRDLGIWLPADTPILKAAFGLMVLMLPG